MSEAPLLQAGTWEVRYDSTGKDLVDGFFVPALRCAKKYDRVTGYFSASVLSLAARGIAGLVHNQGAMRLVVSCCLEPAEVQAVVEGQDLKQLVEAKLASLPLQPKPEETGGLELLAWLVAQGTLQVRVAVPCDNQGTPLAGIEMFHQKAGIVEDSAGDVLAFNGSINETAGGWTGNIESFHVFTSWTGVNKHVEAERTHFEKLWENELKHVKVLNLSEAIAQQLLKFAQPASKLLKAVPPPMDWAELQRLAWGMVRHGPALPTGGESVGEATANIEPWPHQVRAFQRMYEPWPPKLLIADEVGLGKTIEAGLLLRQAWLSGRAKRILIMAPKAVCRQWQVELREKFNLNWPIYDGTRLSWYRSVGLPADRHERLVEGNTWHKEPCVIVSSHLVRRRTRAPELLLAEHYDLVILDEAHHARRKGAGGVAQKGPNLLLRLMQELVLKTEGLLLLTATPMQVHPVEVYDLLKLLGLPAAWSEGAFLQYFDILGREHQSHHEMEILAHLFRAVEANWGPVKPEALHRFTSGSSLVAKRVLGALRDEAKTKRETMSSSDRVVAMAVLRSHTPVSRLVSRNTRALLRAYYEAGKMSARVAQRKVGDEMLPLSAAERVVYEAVEDYIASTYNAAQQADRPAVGFVMTIYRRRLASSFHALRKTLENRLKAVDSPDKLVFGEDDLPDEDEVVADTSEALEADEATSLAKKTLKLEEKSEIERLLEAVKKLPTDTKAIRLVADLRALQAKGYRQVMVFTQFTDTMDFLRFCLAKEGFTIMCFSGRGGEVIDPTGASRPITREDTKRFFKEGKAEILLCTDAAAEGLNFQFCGALVNYDMPWNPMRVEQRIGRIDRLGQQFENIRIVNLHYEDTVEADVYLALQSRIKLFTEVIGKLQPILSKLPQQITNLTFVRREDRDREREALLSLIDSEIEKGKKEGFDLDLITSADLELPHRAPARYDLDGLDILIQLPKLLPPGMEIERIQAQEYKLTLPSLPEPIRVTTSRRYFEEHGDSTELWSPGSPIFFGPEVVATVEEATKAGNLLRILERGRNSQ